MGLMEPQGTTCEVENMFIEFYRQTKHICTCFGHHRSSFETFSKKPANFQLLSAKNDSFGPFLVKTKKKSKTQTHKG